MASDERDEPGRTGTSRRALLLMAGGLAAGAAGAGALTALGRAGGGRPTSTTSPRVSATPVARPVPGSHDWAALRGRLSSRRLVRPDDRGYARARLLFDPRFDDSSRPAGIAYCAVPADVSLCLAFVRRFGIPVAVRSGGHSYGGWSTGAGLVIDVSPMSGVTMNAATGTARVGAGTKLIDLYSALAAQERAVPGGSCPTVGIAGLALGGGVGVVARRYGLTCDNVLSVQIVTADGTVRECDRDHEPDLFWACRGGGGGSFGVATAFTLRTHPVPDLVLFFLRWPWSQAAAVLSGWQAWAPTGPDELWSNMHLSAAPGIAEPVLSVGGTFTGSVAQAQRVLGRLYAAVGSAPGSVSLHSEPYLSAMLVEAGCAPLSVPECHLRSVTAAGVLGRQPELAKSDFYLAALPPAGIATLLNQVQRMGQVAAPAGSVGGVALDALGGVVNRVAPGDTAFVHRDALFLAQYTTSWPGGVPATVMDWQRDWLRSFHAAMRPYAGGQAYQNYPDPELTDWQAAYYGANYARLQQVKAAVDPANVFRFPQSVELP